MPDVLPLVQQSQSKLEPLQFERSKFITKSGLGENTENAMQRGLLESALSSEQVGQDLLMRQRNDKQMFELEKERLDLEKKTAEQAMWSKLGPVGDVIGLLK